MSTRLPSVRALGVAACIAAAFAAGCGGGDDDNPPPPPELVQITANNQVAVARAVVVDFAVLDSTRGAPVASASGAPRARGAETAIKHALRTTIATAGRAVPLGTITISETCPSGGSYTITLDDRDNSGATSAGDVLTTAFNDCRDTSTSMIKGGFTMNYSTYTPTQLSGLLNFGQLTLSDQDGTIALNGPANLQYTDTTDASGTGTVRTELTVAAGGMVASIASTPINDTLTHDQGFNGVWTDVYSADPLAGYDTAELRGTVGFASLSGKVILATDPAIRDTAADDMPSSGTVLITGYQSKLRMTVLNTTTARLELDANNDGTYESTRDIPWSELLPF